MLYIRKTNILCYISHEQDGKCLINSGSLYHSNWLPGSRTTNKQNEPSLTSLLLLTPPWAKRLQLPCCADLPEASRLGKCLFPLYGNQANTSPSVGKWATSQCIPHLHFLVSVRVDNITLYFHDLELPHKTMQTAWGSGWWVEVVGGGITFFRFHFNRYILKLTF